MIAALLEGRGGRGRGGEGRGLVGRSLFVAGVLRPVNRHCTLKAISRGRGWEGGGGGQADVLLVCLSATFLNFEFQDSGIGNILLLLEKEIT